MEDLREDLCLSCAEAPRCFYRHASRRPILFCEEFFAEPGPAIPPAPPGEAPPLDLREGLCTTCESRISCGFPAARDRVIHCEEFR